jgi:hypothetical protein
MGPTIALLLVAFASASPDNIATQLQGMQPAPLSGVNAPKPEYVVVARWPHDHRPRTIFAVLATSSEEGPGELAAFRVEKTGALHRLTSYGDDVRRVELRDVTGDGVDEALVTLSPGNRSAPVEVLQWANRRFRRIGETNDSAQYIDLDHDGIPEIVERESGESNSCDGVTVLTFIQRFSGVEFSAAKEPRPEDVFTYRKVTNEPETVETYWDVRDNAPMHYDVRVINGERGGAHRAAGIKLRLRDASGKDVAAAVPLQLTATDEYTDGSLTLASRCTVASITLVGRIGAVVTLILRANEPRSSHP